MSDPASRDADRWGEAISELARRLHEAQGSLLALVVGPSEAARRLFTADLSAALPAGYEVRSQHIDDAAPNPVAAIQDEGGVERVVFIAHGLGALDEQRRRESLRLMNWSRSQLSRRPVRLVLWVEPSIVRDLYTYAGDFADWWAVLIELPEPPARETLNAEPRPDRWALVDRLIQLKEEDDRLTDVGGKGEQEEIKALTDALCVALQPGQIIAGARLVERRDHGLWLARSLDGAADVLVHSLEGMPLGRGWYLNIETLRSFRANARRFSAREHAERIPGVPSFMGRDPHVLAFATTSPAGTPLGVAILDERWPVHRRAALLVQCCDLANALVRAGLFLVGLKVQDLWVDADGNPALVTLWGAEDEPRASVSASLEAYGVLPCASEVTDHLPIQETMVVFTLGALLGFLLTGEVDRLGRRLDAKLRPDELGDPVEEALAHVAREAMSPRPDDRYPSVDALRQAVIQALETGRAPEPQAKQTQGASRPPHSGPRVNSVGRAEGPEVQSPGGRTEPMPGAGPRRLSSVWLGLIGGLIGAAGPALLVIRQTQELRQLQRDVQATSAELQRTRAELEALRGGTPPARDRPQQRPEQERAPVPPPPEP